MKKFRFIVILLLSCASVFAQPTVKDSLLSALSRSVHDTAKVRILHRLYLLNDSVSYANTALQLATQINYKAGQAQALLDIGRSYYFAGKEDVSLNNLIKCVKIAEESNDKNVLKGAYRYIGFIYRPHEPYKAKEYYEKSLKMCAETGDKLGVSYALSAIGNIYEGIYDNNRENNKKALDYYLRSLHIRETQGSASEQAASYNETSRMYDALGFYTEALQLRLKGLQLAEKTGDIENTVFLCNLLGNNYAVKKDYKTALSYQLRALELGKKKGNNFEVLYDVSKAIGICYNALGDHKQANDYFLFCAACNDSLKEKAKRYDYNLSGIKQGLEKEVGEQKLLLKDLEVAKHKAEVDKQTTLRNAFLIGFAVVFVLILLLFRGYKQKQKVNKQLDRKNHLIEQANRTLAISENKFKQITETINDVFYLYNIVQKKYEYVSPNCTEVLGIDQDYFYTGKSMKAIVHKDDLQLVIDANVKVDNGIPYDIEYRIHFGEDIKWIGEKSSPIFDEAGKLIRNSGICRDITERKMSEEAIRKHDQDMMDSILYAKTIQDAILVPKEKIAERFNEFFVFSIPKEIVSGDFYFYKETKNGVFIAAADCTGHGVPAGFMSMLGNAFLDEIITDTKLITPARVLDQLKELIINSLHQNKTDSESKDGMDIALLYFENNKRYIQFAGAFNPLYIIRGGALQEYEADQFPIGIDVNNSKSPFTNNTVELKEGDTVYIFSDGFADQIGGAQSRKFSKKQMKDVLLDINAKSANEQELTLLKTFGEWKGSEEQIDDVLVIGIKV